MNKLMRLDRLLVQSGLCSRKEAKECVKKGHVKVNDESILKSDYKVDFEKDVIHIDGKELNYKEFEYYMLNKPAGYVSATEDKKDKTVVSLITNSTKNDLFPVGRLDKDTVGLLIITNDGQTAHKLLSPVKHVGKTYYAKIDGKVTENDVEMFRDGIVLKDNTKTLGAELNVLVSGDISEIELTIYEGKFHQVKRMFEAVDKKVIYLKRLSMGSLTLDENLEEGQYRELTSDELEKIIEENV